MVTSCVSSVQTDVERNLELRSGGPDLLSFSNLLPQLSYSSCQWSIFAAKQGFVRQQSVCAWRELGPTGCCHGYTVLTRQELCRLVEDIINNKGLEAKVAWGSIWETSSHSCYNWHPFPLSACVCVCTRTCTRMPHESYRKTTVETVSSYTAAAFIFLTSNLL